MEDSYLKPDERSSLLGSDSIPINDAVYREQIKTASSITGRHLLVWPVAFLFMAANFLTFGTFSQYVYIKLQRDTFPNVTITTKAYCNVDTNSTNYLIQQDVQQKAAVWGIYLYIVGGIPAVVSSFVLGSCTDRLGRKFLFYLSCFGMIFRTVWATVGIHSDWPLYMYIPGYIVEGCTGQVFNIIQVSYIYVSDVTTAGKQRSIGIVLVELAFGLASSFPALAVGFILKQTNSFLLPFYISIGMLSLTLALTAVLPETFPTEARVQRVFESRLENMKDSWSLFLGKENAGRRWMYIIALSVFTLTAYDLYGRLAMEGLYLLNIPFCWGPEELGIFFALRTGLQQIAGMGFVILLKLCLSDEAIAIVGCISFGASFVIEALASTDVMMYVVTVVGTCGLLTIPMIRAIMSKMTSPQKQGAVFSAIAAAETGINIIGAVTSQLIYISTVKIMRGFTFLIFAGCNALSLLLMIIFVIGTRMSKNSYYPND